MCFVVSCDVLCRPVTWCYVLSCQSALSADVEELSCRVLSCIVKLCSVVSCYVPLHPPKRWMCSVLFCDFMRFNVMLCPNLFRSDQSRIAMSCPIGYCLMYQTVFRQISICSITSCNSTIFSYLTWNDFSSASAWLSSL